MITRIAEVPDPQARTPRPAAARSKAAARSARNLNHKPNRLVMALLGEGISPTLLMDLAFPPTQTVESTR